VLGIGKATRLLGHLALTDKAYDATIRLGESTNTDDAEGEITATASAAGVADEALRAGGESLTGPIRQVPPQVSASKVDGKRAYKMARKGEEVALAARPVTVHEVAIPGVRREGDVSDVDAAVTCAIREVAPQASAIKVDGTRAYKTARKGEEVALAARPVTVHEFAITDVRREGDVIDVDASVTCSSGTYIRALARDLGARLGCGGHLTALRRTRVGPYDLGMARTLDQLAEKLEILPMADAVAAAFPRRDVSQDDARKVAHGGRLPAAGLGPGPVGVFGPDGSLLALVEEKGGAARPLAGFAS